MPLTHFLFSRYCVFFAAVKFTVSSNVKYTLQAFFNVSIREMHLSLSLRSWEEIKESVNARNECVIDQAFCKQLALDLR
jgi:hypothetical protein